MSRFIVLTLVDGRPIHVRSQAVVTVMPLPGRVDVGSEAPGDASGRSYPDGRSFVGLLTVGHSGEDLEVVEEAERVLELIDEAEESLR